MLAGSQINREGAQPKIGHHHASAAHADKDAFLVMWFCADVTNGAGEDEDTDEMRKWKSPFPLPTPSERAE